MKEKILITFLILLFCGIVFADDEVHLDIGLNEINRINTGEIDFANEKTEKDDEMEYLKPSFKTIKDMFVEDIWSERKSKNKNK